MDGTPDNIQQAAVPYRRGWVHGSVVLTVLPLAVAMVLLNWHGERWQSESFVWCGFSGSPAANPNNYCTYEYGWPVTFVRRSAEGLSAWSPLAEIQRIDTTALATDAAAVASIVIAASVFLKRFRRAHGALTRWSVRDLLLATGAIAVVCGWWGNIERQWAIEQDVIASLPVNSCMISGRESRPDWLSRIVGRERLAAYDHVQWLTFSDALDDTAIALLADNVRQLRLLEGVAFDGKALTDHGLASVLAAIAPRSIDLPDTAVTGEGLAALPARSLRNLFASGSEFSDAGMSAIADQTALESLNLAGTKVTDVGVRQLAGMSKLKFLDLRGTQISEAAVATLGQLKCLREMFLPEDFPPSGFLRLQALLPNTDLDMAPVGPTSLPAPVFAAAGGTSGGYATHILEQISWKRHWRVAVENDNEKPMNLNPGGTVIELPLPE